ncbi:hypothetical protein BKA70DRAFT_1229794 [Coprinopsis sp. MPI-PUGE-AT-0042]|nr:hypothetical protein BKA70DRAFT_1229794 [Coprinopsis sp. MPI-PUGE-AT-0042]
MMVRLSTVTPLIAFALSLPVANGQCVKDPCAIVLCPFEKPYSIIVPAAGPGLCSTCKFELPILRMLADAYRYAKATSRDIQVLGQLQDRMSHRLYADGFDLPTLRVLASPDPSLELPPGKPFSNQHELMPKPILIAIIAESFRTFIHPNCVDAQRPAQRPPLVCHFVWSKGTDISLMFAGLSLLDEVMIRSIQDRTGLTWSHNVPGHFSLHHVAS